MRRTVRAFRWLSTALLAFLFVGSGQAQAPLPVPLTTTEVTSLLRVAAEALGDATLAVGVVDRGGRILGVYARPGAHPFSADVAVSLARTGAFFSHDQAPLSSRTVRFISGVHFPPGVPNAPVAALYGIENTNRGCQIDAADTSPLPRARAISASGIPGVPAAGACRPNDTSGCARGGPILVTSGTQTLTNYQVGITTGKADLDDRVPALDAPVQPGGAPIYRNGRLIGGVGVAGVTAERAEYAAYLAAAGAAPNVLPVPAEPIPTPGAVFIDGLRLPFFGACLSVECVRQSLQQRPSGSAAGSFSFANVPIPLRAGLDPASGYLIGPVASTVAGGLTQLEVQRLVDQAVTRAALTRAQIRLPLGQTTRMIIAVSDETGRVLAAFRMPDSTIFSFDVALTKARNAYYFSTRDGYDVLRAQVEQAGAGYRWEPNPPAGQGWAITNRTLSFGGQPLFPPGIDLKASAMRGPWFNMFVYDSLNPCTEGPGSTRGGNRQYLNQSGIVWFPGSAPLYRGGRLVGGLGVSGDGVEQDDYVTAGAVTGFEAPADLRADQSFIRTASGASVRLPYWKFPRNPEIR